MSKKKPIKEPVRSGWREIIGILLGAVAIMLLLALISYDPKQSSVISSSPDWGSNWTGLFGAWAAFIVFMFFGVAGWIIPFAVLWIGISAVLWSSRRIAPHVGWFFLILFSLSGLVDMQQIWFGIVESLNIGSPGGLMGEVLSQRTLGRWIGSAGAAIIFVVFIVIGIVRIFDLQLVDLFKQLVVLIKALKIEPPTPEEMESTPTPTAKPKRRRAVRKTAPKSEEAAAAALNIEMMVAAQQARVAEKQAERAAAKIEPVKKNPRKEKEEAEAFVSASASPFSEYRLPSLDLLDPPKLQEKGMLPNEIAETAQTLQDALEEFGVESKVTGVQQGPVVTCYEILPAAGVRVERIKALSDNIALKMEAKSIRIQAPIPGRGVCGIEVPNKKRSLVFLREMIESKAFRTGKHALPLILGKDVNGESIVYDLAKMPHLLIAGATGSGKSVCMNSILTGLLMRQTPDDLRMILVDPKTVEFHQYNNLPHLVVPVITNAKKVALGLKWAIDEMERRFKWFRQAGVRDLSSFNARALQQQAELFSSDEVTSETDGEPTESAIPERLPYIVIVIDELADLMAVAQAEIEAGIARLAAKSRAAGIHMILATQRPDVKVITGTIKANFPVRIAFKVAQKVDSRTILDRMGADALLGDGDMLILPPGTDKLIRLQGAYTSDAEIERVTNFCCEQFQPEFIAEIHDKIERPTTELPEIDTGEDDEIVEQAIEVIRQTKRASTSSLQRRLRIGYTRAARVMDLLEERGMIGPPDGAGPREILIDFDGEIPRNPGGVENGTD